jgi:hypothetical protein
VGPEIVGEAFGQVGIYRRLETCTGFHPFEPVEDAGPPLGRLGGQHVEHREAVDVGHYADIGQRQAASGQPVMVRQRLYHIRQQLFMDLNRLA